MIKHVSLLLSPRFYLFFNICGSWHLLNLYSQMAVMFLLQWCTKTKWRVNKL